MNIHVDSKQLLQWRLFRRNGAIQVLLILIGMSDEDGVYSSSIAYLEEMCNLSHVTVMAVLRDLEKDGVISNEDGKIRLERLPSGITNATTEAPQEAVQEIITPVVIPESADTAEIETTEKKKPSKRFVKPTLEEIESYIREKNLNVDAEYFFAYHESGGWMIGKKPMKNWKAACRTFHLNAIKYNQNKLSQYERNRLEARQLFAAAEIASHVNPRGAEAGRVLLPD